MAGVPGRALLAALFVACITRASGIKRSVELLGNDTGNCTVSPCASLQYAFTQSVASDTIVVGPGTYRGTTNRNILLQGATDLIIMSSDGPTATILDLEGAGRAFSIPATASNVTIQGFTIINGNCAPLPRNERRGAAIQVAGVGPKPMVLSDLLIRNMSCFSRTSGMGADGLPLFAGGAVHSKNIDLVMEGVKISDSSAFAGGCVAHDNEDGNPYVVTTRNSELRRCVSVDKGGCMYIQGFGMVRHQIEQTLFSECSANSTGGHVYVEWAFWYARNSIFEFGTSRLMSGSIHVDTYFADGSLTNSVVRHNSAPDRGAVSVPQADRFRIENVTFFNNSASTLGTALHTMGRNMTVRNSLFSGNRAVSRAGVTTPQGAFAIEGHATVWDSVFENNVGAAGSVGAAVVVVSTGTPASNTPGAWFRRVQFINNTASRGGAMSVPQIGESTTASDVYLFDCLFENNTATDDGGALSVNGLARFRAVNITFRGNRAQLNGGAATFTNVQASASLVINRSSFISNTALRAAAVWMQGTPRAWSSPISLWDNKFIRNSVPARPGAGAAVEIRGFTHISDNYFEGNQGHRGGALAVWAFRGATVRRCTFVSNRGDTGGGIAFMDPTDSLDISAELLVEDCLFQNNNATDKGGALQLAQGGRYNLRNNSFCKNIAAKNGGAVSVQAYQDSSSMDVTISASRFSGNAAGSFGGSIGCTQTRIDGLALTIQSTRISNSTAKEGGGGLAFDCEQLTMTDVSFRNNSATDGSGGALFFSTRTKCGPGSSTFRGVRLLNNSAMWSGGAVYFSEPKSPCVLPDKVMETGIGPWDGSSWSWWNVSWPVPDEPNVDDCAISTAAMSTIATNATNARNATNATNATNETAANVTIATASNFTRGNVAPSKRGSLQASAPMKLQVNCSANQTDPSNCTSGDVAPKLTGFPGMAVNLNVTLLDTFDQEVPDGAWMVEVQLENKTNVSSQNESLWGSQRFLVQDSKATISGLQIKRNTEVTSATLPQQVKMLVRLVRTARGRDEVPAVSVNVTLGICPVGYVWKNEETACVACAAGNYRDQQMTECSACESGTFASKPGSSMCTECPAGHGCPRGASLPAPCPAGSFQAFSGQEKCNYCQNGRFQPKTTQTSCELCPGNRTTSSEGTIEESRCICPEGRYLARRSASDIGVCADCPDGLVCPGGVDLPKQAARYFAQLDPSGDTTKFPVIVRCKDETRCPRGLNISQCPNNRGGMACNVCLPGYYEANDGRCLDCTGTSVGGVVGVVLLCLLILLVGSYLVASYDLPVHCKKTLTIAIGLGILINGLQTVSTFTQLNINWVEPMKSMKAWLSILSIQLEVLQPGCVLATNSALLKYIASLLTFPALALVVLAGLGIASLRGKRVTIARVADSEGLLMLMVFLSLAVTTVLPWQCETNPDETASMAASRGVICWKSAEHSGMVVSSLIGILVYDAGFLTVVAHASLRYPQKVMQPGAVDFLRRYSFLFSRFAPRRYYYGLLYLFRNLCIALVPVLLVNAPEAQVMLMALMISMFCAAQSRLWPWQTEAANYLDLVCSFGLIMLLVAGAMFTEGKQQGFLVMQHLIMALFCLVLVIALTTIAFNAYLYIFPPLKYGAFLCHHKVGAGSLARWFKLSLQARTKDVIFLDSDELDRLDLLFDQLGYNCKNLIVLLTRDVLTRMWCAGEIATAVRRGITIVPVACNDYEPPTDEFIEQLGDLWTENQKAELSSLGIEIHHIQYGFRVLRDLPVTKFDYNSSDRDLERMFEEVHSRCRKLAVLLPSLGVGTRATATVGDMSEAEVLLVGNLRDSEAAMTCRVIRRMLQRQLQAPVAILGEGSNSMPKDFKNARCLAVVLTAGMLQMPAFAALLVQAVEVCHLNVTPVNADQGFPYPDPRFWQELEDGKVVEATAEELKGISLTQVVQAYKALYNVIALRFTIWGSERIQTAEIAEMQSRFRALESKEQMKTRSQNLFHDANKETTTVKEEIVASNKIVEDVEMPPSPEAFALLDLPVTPRQHPDTQEILRRIGTSRL